MEVALSFPICIYRMGSLMPANLQLSFEQTCSKTYLSIHHIFLFCHFSVNCPCVISFKKGTTHSFHTPGKRRLESDGYLKLTGIFFFFFLFKAAPVAYGSSQARGPIKTAAAGLHCSHSSSRFEPYL